MGVFDYIGANNAPDAGGAGAPPVPPPASIPSTAAPAMSGAPTPVPEPDVDPRLATVLASLQPKPVAPWQAALQKIAPIIGALVAIKQGAGGAFANEYQQIEQQHQVAANNDALRKERLATILHQQQMEQHQARMESVATKRIEAAAAKEHAAANEKLLRDEWNSQAQQGNLIDTINDLIRTQGPEAADRYMASTHIGSLTADGVPHTVKDLVDRYAVRAPDGTLIGGKSKTPKEAKAGTLEDWVNMAEELASRTRGRDLTTEERQAVDQEAIKKYKTISQDPDAQELKKATAQVQLSIDRLRADQLKNQIDEMNAAKGEIKSGTKEFGIARDLAYGILSYSDFARMYAFQRSGREQMRKIYDKAREINPDFSPSLFEQGAKFAGNPGTRRSMAAVANVESGIPSMVEASNAAARTGVKFINQHFVVPGGVQFGDHTYSDLESAHKAFADELSLALGVGTASDLKTKLGLDIADPNLPPDKFESVLKTQVMPFLERRRASLKGQMGPYGVGKASDMLPAEPGAAKPVPGMPGVTVTKEQ